MSRDLSMRASVSIVASAAVVAAALVVLTWPGGKDDGDGSRLTADQSRAVTTGAAPSTPTSAPTSTPTSTAVLAATTAPTARSTGVPGADLEFPKVSGDWTLNSVALAEGLEGTFGGTGVIAYTGKRMGTGTFTLVVYSKGRAVAILRGATSRANPKTSTTVSWVSSDAWVKDHDGYTFSAT